MPPFSRTPQPPPSRFRAGRPAVTGGGPRFGRPTPGRKPAPSRFGRSTPARKPSSTGRSIPGRRVKKAAKGGLAATLMSKMPKGKGLLALGGLAAAGAAAARKQRSSRPAHQPEPFVPPQQG